MKRFNELPIEYQCDEVKYYYDILSKKKLSLVLTRIFDICVSLGLLVLLSPILLIIAIWIKADSKGPVF
ncbi:MAG: sugar transferase, partial [Erysipelotrichaceae bacterium]|nr:sugar transferase [Erysipelotrichaceae bacterium]